MGRSIASVSSELLLPSLHALLALAPEIARQAVDTGLEILAADGYVETAGEGAFPSRIAYETIIDVLENSRRVSGDPAFGLSGGRGLQRGDLGVFQFVTSSAATLGESMLLAARYMPLLHDGARVYPRESGDQVVLEYRDLPGLPQSTAANEYVLSAMLVSSQQALGFVAPPSEACFAHPEPAHADAYQPIFGSSIRFDCEHNALVLPRVALDLPLATADLPLLIVMRRHADELLRRRPHADPLVQQARNWVRSHLAEGAHLGALAEALNMSGSTLQRRLRYAGTSRSDIVDDVRRELAPEALSDTNLNISEVAFRLGFSHSPAFHRAFRRWFGRSPNDYRKSRPKTGFDQVLEQLRTAELERR